MINKKDVTIIICCAGMGKRLGIGTTKALLDIDGKPLIIRQLELLNGFDDIRIVAGYQAENLIKTVTSYRKDVMFAFNYNYEETSVVYSIKKAIINPRKYIVEIDGDLLLNSSDLMKLLDYPGECVAGTKVYSDNPVYVNVKNGRVIGFNNFESEYEWTGLAKIESSRLLEDNEFYFLAIKDFLPLDFIEVNSRDIDTINDYINAINLYKKNF